MDKPIEKKPVYYRYRWHIAGAMAFVILLIYVSVVASGGRKLRTEAENLIIGEVQADKFLEYVDVEGVVQPILTIKINAREAGSVERIVAEEGTMMQKRRHHPDADQPRPAAYHRRPARRMGEATDLLSGKRNRIGTKKPGPAKTDLANHL